MLQYSSNSETKETPTEDCVLDCPKTDKSCNQATCCGTSKQVLISIHTVTYPIAKLSPPVEILKLFRVLVTNQIRSNASNTYFISPYSDCYDCLRCIESEAESLTGRNEIFIVYLSKKLTVSTFQGRETPSPAETPYLCRQRSGLSRLNNQIPGDQQELHEMERGHLLSPPTSHQLPHTHLISPTA